MRDTERGFAMSDNKPCEVYDIGITAFRQLFPDNETNVGDYLVACSFGSFGWVNKQPGLNCVGKTLEDCMRFVQHMYRNDLLAMDYDIVSGHFGSDYEVWHVVEDNPSCLECEDYPYWVALCEVDETDEGEPCWVPAEYVSFRTESEAQMFAERVCGYPFMRTEVGSFYPIGRLLHRYKCIVTPSGRKLVKRGW